MRNQLAKFDLYSILFQQLPRHYRREDAIMHGIVGVMILASIVLRVVNYFFYGYTPLGITSAMAAAIPGLIVVLIAAVFMKQRFQRSGLFVEMICQCYLFVVASFFFMGSIILTPFPVVDHQLQAIDVVMGFDLLGVMNWVASMPWLDKILSFSYDTWFFQIVLTPILLALLCQQREIDRYLVAVFASLLVGSMIYYFWPTIAPAGILESSHFLSGQHDLVTRFNEVHQGKEITVSGGGLISFPSFHVINSLLVTFAWRRYRFVFIPLVILNIFSIFSTMGLGYHYIVDVIGGFIIAGLSIVLARYLCPPKKTDNKTGQISGKP
jgi:membrane-associated phospholipid phosphatase